MRSKDSISHPEFLGEIGLGRADITPSPNIFARSWGSSTHTVASGIHKPLFASCIMFRSPDSEQDLYIISADLSYWRDNSEEIELREQILRRCGLEENQFIFHLSHTHSAPSTHLVNIDRTGGNLIQAFRDKIVDGCVSAIGEAQRTVAKSCLTWAYGTCQLAQNRDQEVETDTGSMMVVGLNPSQGADDTLLVGRVVNTEGKTRAVLVNYACHPVSLGGGNSLISPDYVGQMRELIESEISECVCIFLHGASGELTPRISYASDTEAADKNGLEIGYAVLSTLVSMLPAQTSLEFDCVEESGAKLGRWASVERPASRKLVAGSAHVDLSYFNLPTLQEIDQLIESSADNYMNERLLRRRLLRQELGDGRDRVIDFPVWQLGGSIFVSLPAEPYSEFQISLRKRFPDTAIVVMSIANGYFSYLPTKSAYEVDDLYQVNVALFKKGCLEQTIRSVGNTICDLVGTETNSHIGVTTNNDSERK